MPRRMSDQSPAAVRLRRQNRLLMTGLVRDLRRVRRLLRLNERGHADSTWVDALQAIVGRYGQAAAALAADFYEAERALADARGRFVAALEDPPGRDHVEAVANWAASPLREVDGEPLGTPEQAQQRAEAGAQKMATDTGRATILRAVRSDREAVAWARSAALGACAFCKMLASRGAVYKDREAVGRAADARFEGRISEIKVHDHCHCQPIPVFRRDQFALSSQAAEWDAIYRQFAAPHSGDQVRRFREALRGIEEGRIEWSPPRTVRRAA